LRRTRDVDEWVVLAAADPANLAGVTDDPPRAPVANRRLAFRNGAAVAARAGTAAIEWLAELDAPEQRRAADVLAGEHGSAPPAQRVGGWSRA